MQRRHLKEFFLLFFLFFNLTLISFSEPDFSDFREQLRSQPACVPAAPPASIGRLPDLQIRPQRCHLRPPPSQNIHRRAGFAVVRPCSQSRHSCLGAPGRSRGAAAAQAARVACDAFTETRTDVNICGKLAGKREEMRRKVNCGSRGIAQRLS